jgi:glycine/D-amino acid oxidase-like deaminating enzyme
MRVPSSGAMSGSEIRPVPRRPSTTSAPDVIVIGGGIVGVSCAAHLAASGRRVMLLERTEIAAAASGRNSGVVQHPFDPVLVDLHLETVRLYRHLTRTVEGDFALPSEPAGLLLVSPDADLARRLAERLTVSHPGLSPAFLDPDAAHAMEPALARDVAACRLAMGYPVGPVAATRAYATWATRLGVEIRVGELARPWLEPGRVAGVELANGERLAAAEVVVAAGPWTPEVIDRSGAWRPIRPLWGVVVDVSLPQPPVHVLEEAEIEIEPAGEPIDPGAAKRRASLADAARPEASEPDVAFSLVTAAGASSLGSTFLDHEPDAAAIVPAILARGATFVPAIASAEIGAHRACARPLSLDGRPLVGRVPGIDGLWVAAGHGPWGISTGPASGRLLADLLDGGIAAPPPALDPRRFAPPPLG